MAPQHHHQSARHEPSYDDAVVGQILLNANKRKLMSLGEFGHFVRHYLASGYSREVAEVHRRYFRQQSDLAVTDVLPLGMSRHVVDRHR